MSNVVAIITATIMTIVGIMTNVSFIQELLMLAVIVLLAIIFFDVPS